LDDGFKAICTPRSKGAGAAGRFDSETGVGVTYTRSAMRHKDQIVLQYAVSDTFSNFATIKISALLQMMKD
jgi:hypothetical protein